MCVFENKSKPTAYCPTGSIHLETVNSKIWIEIRSNSSLVSRIEFPNSASGYRYANRVFNGLC